MNKLLRFWDNYILKIGVIITSLFIVLYPKLPSIHITYTWVYIRLEDFFILGLVLLWFLQVIRRKVKVALPLGIPILLYWLVGLATLIYSILFIGPHLTQFFPKIAALEYARRIEYMILFFVGFSTIKSVKDIKDYVKFMFVGVTAVVLYGLGQHFYPYFWKYLPEFIQKTNFCFPSFQTGNEEFAKGIPLCLPVGSRVTSTFGGHYDLAAYLLITLPIVLGTWFLVKKKIAKIGLGILFITGLITLILTSSRIAFGAYLFAIVTPLILLKKKKWIAPILILSVICLVLFSESTIHRFAQTFRLTSVVVNMQGQVVGTTESNLSEAVKQQLQKGNKAVQANQIVQGAIPEGTSFITLPQKRIATSTAVIQQGLSQKDAERLKLANGGLELSTIKGNFSVQKALVYDISVTTRLQGEWPRAVQSFLENPLLGAGYSTLTLAVDNDYLRLLGESGILGFMTFLGIFLIFGIFLRKVLPSVEDKLVRVYVYGLIGGVIGLFVNAALFDIFEASKVAEPLWLMIGLGAGAVALYQKRPVAYLKQLAKIATANIFLYAYLLAITIGTFWGSISNFFVGDDFVWLKWAANSTFSDIPKYFTDASGFFYRPIDKTLMLLFYSLFSFQPQGYHVVLILIQFLMSVAVYLLLKLVLQKKLWAFLGAVLFLLLPMHAENIFWISGLSIDLASVCMLFAIVLYIKSVLFGSWKAPVRYIGAIILAVLGLLSYELSIVLPVLLFISDIFITKKMSWKRLYFYIPFILADCAYLTLRVVSHAFSMGGDYAYNLLHFLPNVVGNVVGYFGLFIFGELSIPLYTALRMNTKAFAVPILIAVILIAAVLVVILRKMNWKDMIKNSSQPLYAIIFSIVALLPYLGLGNIAERYGYLSSVGFVLLVMWVAQYLFTHISIRKIGKYALCVIVAALILTGCVLGLQKAYNEWGFVSKVTYNTLGYFKIEYPTLSANSTFIIVNRPIRYANAWIFPVGFPEGLWFVYGDQTPQVIDASSTSQALQLAKSAQRSHIFSFDSTYQVHEIK